MAGVTPVNLSEQIRLVAGLRWRIMRNGLRKKNNVADLIGMVFVSILGSILILGGSLGFYFLGQGVLSHGRLELLQAPFWGIFLFWQTVPIFAAGFGAKFDFRSLLRFPFSRTAFYVIGLAYGLADFPSLASIFWLLSMTAGASSAMPSIFPAMFAVVLLFIVLNVTIERLVGSWIERLLARRRTRELFFGLFILSMFSLQFISPIQRRFFNKGAGHLLKYLKYLAPLPPSLSARAVAGAARHDFLSVAIGFAGVLIFVAVFSGLLWQRYSAQYKGEELSEGVAPTPRRAAIQPQRGSDHSEEDVIATDTGWKSLFGLLSPPIRAMVHKEFQYLFRNGYAFLLMILPPAQILLFSSQFAGRRTVFGGRGVNLEYFFPGMMAYTILILMGPAYNAFSHEGKGIQTYFMTPLRFQDILAGKNIVTVTVLTLEILICGAVLAWRAGLPPAPVVASTLLALIFTIIGQLPLANWSSLSFPRKLDFGSMRNQRNSGVSVWLMFGAQLLLAAISSVVLWTSRLTHNPWLAAEAFALLGAAAVGGYVASLAPLAGLAEKKKETLIETLCR